MSTSINMESRKTKTINLMFKNALYSMKNVYLFKEWGGVVQMIFFFFFSFPQTSYNLTFYQILFQDY